MIRVLTANEPNAVMITIDGQLVGAYVDAVETCVNQAIAEQRPVHLFLRKVSNIDESGRTLLSRLAAKGVELSAFGVYSSYVVGEIRRGPAWSGKGPRPANRLRPGTSAEQATPRSPHRTRY